MKKNNAPARLFVTLTLMTIICGFTATPGLASTAVRFKQVQNLVVVQVLINETGPFDFIFDTGASSSVVDFALVKQLNLGPVESSSVLTVAGSKTVPRYRLDSLVLGSKSVRNLTVLGSELREIHAISAKIRGVLGQNFLSGFDYILNYRDQRIEFEDNGEFTNALQGVRVPIERDHGRVLIATQPTSSQKRASRLVIDSGAASIVVFKAASRDSDLEIDLDANSELNASTIVGSQMISTGRLRKLQTGNEKFSGLPARMVNNRAGAEGRFETGLVPASLFRAIYFNNSQNFVILNPRSSIQQSVR
jgi:predicted aspartyl protease